MTQQSAVGQMDFASSVAKRLPKTFAALGAGQIHPVHLRIIEDEIRYLTDADAATADALLAEAAPGMTFGELRYAARKLVLKLDPDTARKRKEAARREAHVRRFREESGNAGMVARELPSDKVLASWQHVEQRAQELRAAWHPPPRTGPPGTGPPGTGPPGTGPPGTGPPGTGPPGTGPPGTDPPGTGPPGILATPLIPVARGSCDHARAQAGYHPGRTLVHLIRARNNKCTAPGCGRPAARCDLDHTTAWDQGGRTCECNLAPRCKR